MAGAIRQQVPVVAIVTLVICSFILAVWIYPNVILASAKTLAKETEPFLPILVALFTGLLWWSNRRLTDLNAKMVELNERHTWFTGAVESHSDQMRRMRAYELGIPPVWWDPNQEKRPDTGQHRDLVGLDFIPVNIRLKDRTKQDPDVAPNAKPMGNEERKKLRAKFEEERRQMGLGM